MPTKKYIIDSHKIPDASSVFKFFSPLCIKCYYSMQGNENQG